MDTIALRLDRILVDPALQPRLGGLDAGQVAALVENPDGWPPLIAVEDGGYRLVDGFHRFAAAQNLNRKTVPVQVLEMPADGDLAALAFALNALHGQPLTLADRRAFAARLLRRDPASSDREVGRRAGLSQPTVAKVRTELEAGEEIEATETRVGRGGYTYTTDRGQARHKGELPEDEETFGERFFGARERRAQRRLARYFDRLAVALEDGYDLPGWETADDAAQACRLVFGDKEAAELGVRLGPAAENVVEVARALGYERPA